MNHDPEIYGPDASEFKPERHLDSSCNIKDENDEGHFSYGFGFRYVSIDIDDTPYLFHFTEIALDGI
jgi:hypothetical protein